MHAMIQRASRYAAPLAVALVAGALAVTPSCVCNEAFAPMPPVAVIAGPSTARVGETVTLDGSGSFSPPGTPFVFNWMLATVPTASRGVALDNREAIMPSLVPDVPGVYRVELFVATASLRSATVAHEITVGDPDGGIADGGIGIDAAAQDAGATDASVADAGAGACGGADQPCCVGATECMPGLTCMGSAMRTCIGDPDASVSACGGVGQGCCGVLPPAEPCDPGLICIGTVADSMCVVPFDAGPVACGNNGEICCASVPYCVAGLTCRSHLPLPSRCAP